MGKNLVPYRRAPGTVDAGADFARQLEKQDTPPFGEVLKDVSVPADGARHFFRHRLGRPFLFVLIGGYRVYRDGVFTDTPERVKRAGYDPAKWFSVFAHSAADDNVVTFWVV